MTVTITQKNIPAFIVSGITVRTTNHNESDPATAKLANHWGTFFVEGLAEKIPHRLKDSPIYGVYSSYESDVNGAYNLTAGVAVSKRADAFETIEVEEGTYMVFESKGPMPETIINTWKKVWEFFKENTDVKRKYTTDFEIYKGLDECVVCIAIEK